MMGDYDRLIGEAYKALIAMAIVVIILCLIIGFLVGRASAAELTGSQVITVERSDDGELYAALSVVLDLPVTPAWSAVLIHDQAATWHPVVEGVDRRAEWDASLAWRPTPGWSVSLGRRWRVGPPPDYEGPWVYVQVWRGM